LMAYADLTIAESFVIRGLRVLVKKDAEAPFVVFPATLSKSADNSRWFDVAHPTTAEARKAATDAVLTAYAAAKAAAA
ncbi:MAG: hypothetical protein A2V88_09170, partial [Elusimicrobia bacterium RBG_16_66_12]